MESTIPAMRREYSDHPLNEGELSPSPLDQFLKWFGEAVDAEIYEPNAMVLCTNGEGGIPSSRVVLLKELNKGGFVFFTNYESRKAQEIAANPFASLLFYWPELHRQVRIAGSLSKTTETENCEYFMARPRGAQVGAWASVQSAPLSSRDELENRVREMEAKFEGVEVPCPPHWGGYRLAPTTLEFWQGRRSRLHDRIMYQKNENGWEISRLSP